MGNHLHVDLYGKANPKSMNFSDWSWAIFFKTSKCCLRNLLDSFDHINLKQMTSVSIIGGGISGCCLALFLKKVGIKCEVYEANEKLMTFGGSMNIACNGFYILKQLGLEKKLKDNGALISGFAFMNHKGEHLATMNMGKEDGVTLMRGDLLEILHDEVVNQNIPYHFRKKLLNLETNEDKAVCHFEDGTQLESSIVVGADGIRSKVREFVVNNVKPEYVGVIGVGGEFSRLDFPELNLGKNMQQTKGYLGGFGITPSKDDQMIWWSNVPQEKELSREELKELKPKMKGRLLELFKGWHSPIEKLVEQSNMLDLLDAIYDLPDLETWSKGRIVLIGDACHAMSPNAGQGASQAIEDSITLAKYLKKYEFKEAFKVYENERKPRAEKIKLSGRQNSDKLQSISPFSAWLRDLMISWLFPLLGDRMMSWIYDHRIDLE
eukprot:NODE_66_length_25735_cov_0.318497.p7 type:complete len:436 gc:universal NODE_66_length_25735_cov_0.318497:24172-25479(+)